MIFTSISHHSTPVWEMRTLTPSENHSLKVRKARFEPSSCWCWSTLPHHSTSQPPLTAFGWGYTCNRYQRIPYTAELSTQLRQCKARAHMFSVVVTINPALKHGSGCKQMLWTTACHASSSRGLPSKQLVFTTYQVFLTNTENNSSREMGHLYLIVSPSGKELYFFIKNVIE